MEHISGIIKRVMEGITEKEEPDKERQRQWDDAMGELDAQDDQDRCEAEDAGCPYPPRWHYLSPQYIHKRGE